MSTAIPNLHKRLEHRRLINRHPDRGGRLLLILLPFALLLFAYFIGSAARLTDNPNDKLLPSASQMVAAVDRLAFTEDPRGGNYLFWQDSAASLKRLGLGIGIAALLGLCLGIVAGILPLFRPGMLRVAAGGVAIEVEVWQLPSSELGSFLTGIPVPLDLGKVQPTDGRWESGFICEPYGLEGATNISQFGGWRGYLRQPS